MSTTNRRVELVPYVRTRADGGNARNWVFCMNQLGGVGRRWGQAAGPGNRGGVHAPCQALASFSRIRYPRRPKQSTGYGTPLEHRSKALLLGARAPLPSAATQLRTWYRDGKYLTVRLITDGHAVQEECEQCPRFWPCTILQNSSALNGLYGLGDSRVGIVYKGDFATKTATQSCSYIVDSGSDTRFCGAGRSVPNPCCCPENATPLPVPLYGKNCACAGGSMQPLDEPDPEHTSAEDVKSWCSSLAVNILNNLGDLLGGQPCSFKYVENMIEVRNSFIRQMIEYGGLSTRWSYNEFDFVGAYDEEQWAMFYARTQKEAQENPDFQWSDIPSDSDKALLLAWHNENKPVVILDNAVIGGPVTEETAKEAQNLAFTDYTGPFG